MGQGHLQKMRQPPKIERRKQLLAQGVFVPTDVRPSRRSRDGDAGFTLIELLVVIAILGILAGIVVFSVAGITGNGQAAACATEKSTIVTAEETYFAKVGAYTNTAGLTAGPNAFLATQPSWYDGIATGTHVVIKPAGTAAGCS
jgi:prepilin-type N-terminal cleavage/methylation domain-containing protein